MKVRIGALELSDVSLEDLDELVKRYGGAAIEPVAPNGAGGEKPKNKPATTGHGDTTDVVVLRKFVEAGAVGLPTKDLGDVLGRRGKATYGAARKWALRVHLVGDETLDPFEKCRIGTQRAIRIKPSLMDVAKAHLPK